MQQSLRRQKKLPALAPNSNCAQYGKPTWLVKWAIPLDNLKETP
jgi:hypothetical protein